MLERIAHELGAARKAQLLHDVSAVRLGCPDRDEELRRDLLVRMAEGQESENLALTFGERVLLGPASFLRICRDELGSQRRSTYSLATETARIRHDLAYSAPSSNT